MYLERLHLQGLGPFEDVALDFLDAKGDPRRVTVVHGDGGTGKSTLVAAIENTRPGHAIKGALFRQAMAGAQVAAAWRVHEEDPERAHRLSVVTPGASLDGLDEERERLRRREQAYFDKLAQGSAGFLVMEFSEHRSFPRAAIALQDPGRALLRHETRQPAYSDRGRFELTRKIKQVLAYAELAGALLGEGSFAGGEGMDPRRLGDALHAGLHRLEPLTRHRYAGVDPLSFEPLFETPDGRLCHFDEIAKQVRHLVAFLVLGAHALWVRAEGRDPREAQGVMIIDEIELGLQPRVAAGVLEALRDALPAAQWIATTSSPIVAASVPADALLALRRLPDHGRVELYTHELARTH